MNDCPYHLDHENRMARNETDIQKQFEKIGEALSLMYKVDKRLEGLYGKIAGISAAVTTGVIVVLWIADKVVR